MVTAAAVLALTGGTLLAQSKEQKPQSRLSQARHNRHLDPAPFQSIKLKDFLAGQLPMGSQPQGRSKSVQTLPDLPYATRIGYTFLDVQSHSANTNRIFRNNNGEIGVVWLHSRGGCFGGRLTGYNSYVPSRGWYGNGTEADSLKYAIVGEAANYCGLVLSPLTDAVDRGRLQTFPSILGFEQSGNRQEWVGYGAFSTVDQAAGRYRIAALSRNVGQSVSSTRPWGAPSYNTAFPGINNAGGNRTQFVESNGVIHGVTCNYVDTADAGNHGTLIYVRSNDGGATWTSQVLPGTSLADGIGSVSWMFNPYTLAANGNTIAVVGTFQNARQIAGLTSLLIKSTDGGATWTRRILDRATANMADVSTRVNPTTGSGGSAVPGVNSYLFNDGAYSVLVDDNGLVHVTVGRGWQSTDSTGLNDTHFFGFNGNFANDAGSLLMYWNENFPANERFKAISEFVDGNNDGDVSFPNTATIAAGDFMQGAMSMSKLSIDRQGRLYCVYSALLEGSDLVASQLNRDIYIIASEDAGRTWSPPINLAKDILGFDDGATRGDGIYDDSYPVIPTRVANDDTLAISWLVDEVSGANDHPLVPFQQAAVRAKWGTVKSSVYLKNVHVNDIWKAIAHANFPSVACGSTQHTITWHVPDNVPAGTTLEIQVDTSTLPPAGVFRTSNNTLLSAGTIVTNGTSGTASITLPAVLQSGIFRIRLFNASLATQVRWGAKDITLTPGAPGAIAAAPTALTANALVVCAGSGHLYETDGDPDATSIKWQIDPPGAGTAIPGDISGTGNEVSVSWSRDFDGVATLRAIASNACGDGAASPALSVTVVKNAIRRNATNDSLIADVAGNWFINDRPLAGGSNTRRVRINPSLNATYAVQTPNGCLAHFITTPGYITGISANPSLKSSVNLYPNPARGSFTVELADWTQNESSEVSLMSLTGQLLARQTVQFDGQKGEARLSTAGLAPGVYLVRITSQGEAVQRKLVVE